MYKEFSDPLYGFVRIDLRELSLIDSMVFQRLRYVKQLGLAYLVFPSAHHTRFEHALGVLHIADSILRGSLRDPDARTRTLVRLAALLHDLGHPPFSHTTEVLLPRRRTHEDVTRRIVLESEVYETLRRNFDLSHEDVELLLRITLGKPEDEEERLLSELITGQFGADRMDYLRRDAFFCGVSYGLFDLNRLLSTLQVVFEEGRRVLAVHRSGLRALENFLISRHFMYLQVYFHKVVRILSIHLVELIRKILPEESFDRLETFLRMNDCTVLSRALAEPACREDLERLFGRKHFKEVFSTKERELFEELRRELLLRYPAEVLRFDEARKDPYDEEVFIFDGSGIARAGEVSDLIASLKPIEIYRVYVKPELRGEVCSLLRRLV